VKSLVLTMTALAMTLVMGNGCKPHSPPVAVAPAPVVVTAPKQPSDAQIIHDLTNHFDADFARYGNVLGFIGHCNAPKVTEVKVEPFEPDRAYAHIDCSGPIGDPYHKKESANCGGRFARDGVLWRMSGAKCFLTLGKQVVTAQELNHVMTGE